MGTRVFISKQPPKARSARPAFTGPGVKAAVGLTLAARRAYMVEDEGVVHAVQAVMAPPFKGSTWPVIQEASAEAR